MVKSDRPLQIRLTEPVIFLRGPSTGYDFRGRPQVVREDAPPAMLRGLLTLRLNKATRIRKIDIKLEGKARTEWPEGIGPRRLETFEEHDIIRESTVFYTYKQQSESRSRSQRRAVSVGPGVGRDVDDEDLETVGIPEEGGEDDWTSIQRGRDRIPRSASALPGTHDGLAWHREEFSRNSSYNGDSPGLAPPPGLEALSIAERGPSPAYTPEARPTRSNGSSRRSSLRLNGNGTTNPSQAPILSPIASAAPSRAPSDRTDSTSTERRFAKSPQGPTSDEIRHLPGVLEGLESEPGPSSSRPGPRPILDDGSRRTSTSNVRFDETPPPTMPATVVESSASETEETDEVEEMHQSRRAASIRTNHSAESGSNASMSNGHSQFAYHPTTDAVQAISTVSTPAPSRPASIIARSSIEEPSTGTSSSQVSGGSAPGSRRSSFRRDSRVTGLASGAGSTVTSPAQSRADLAAVVRVGRSSRNGSATTIVYNPDVEAPTATAAPQAESSSRRPSGSLAPGPSRPAPKKRDSSEDRGRKFSLTAALRGLSQDVKDRVRQSSKSRTRAGPSRGGSFSNAPPLPSGAAAYGSSSMSSRSGSAIPQRLVEDSHRNGRAISREVTPPGEFIPPHGAGGAGRARSGSRDRTASPSSRSQSRGRGRNMGMKALTGKFTIGEGDDEAEEDNEPVHHWKEFRKGTYNYPISFQVPVDAPPTIHAEFGSVTYKLKATVVRVGALTPNLVEEIEVTMIATPQEDDLEESENVIVERQWEEQMRYQIALSGKAFPIGGTIPISVRLMPLMKCRIHRLTVTLEEKTDYYAQNRKVARHEQPRRFPLLFIKQPDKKERIEPLLPILSDDPNAARSSPLAELARVAYLNNPSERPEYDLELSDRELADDNMLAGLMDPLGPWHLEQFLQVPDCSLRVRFTTKHDKTNISTTHILKVTIRVERGDDVALDTKGRRKQFDIIIETPIKILDCRVNPAWNSLPTYSSTHPAGIATPASVCSVHNNPRKQVALAPSATGAPPYVPGSSTRPTDSRISGLVPLSTVRERQTPGGEEDTLLERNIVYDRLMSGQETEMGEVPPTYGQAVGDAIRSASRSASRARGRGRDGDDVVEVNSRSMSRLGERER